MSDWSPVIILAFAGISLCLFAWWELQNQKRRSARLREQWADLERRKADLAKRQREAARLKDIV